MTLIDTSALFALADEGDARHEAARRILEELRERGEPLLVHNYLLVEALALFASRLGHDSIRVLLAETEGLEVAWVDEGLHRAALEAYARRSPRGSFVDQVSFQVMRSCGVTHAFAFDRDFTAAGFRLHTP